jgi:hypothetical protein
LSNPVKASVYGKTSRKENLMPGKFEGNEDERVAEILYDSTMEGGQDEESGDIQETGIWSALIRGIEVRPGDTPEIQDGFPGGYIVQEDEQGFFTYTEFDSDEKLEESWNYILEQDEKFQSEGESEDDG